MLMSVKMIATPALITVITLKVLTNAHVLVDTFSMTPHV
jgi:hypothetical protein